MHDRYLFPSTYILIELHERYIYLICDRFSNSWTNDIKLPLTQPQGSSLESVRSKSIWLFDSGPLNQGVKGNCNLPIGERCDNHARNQQQHFNLLTLLLETCLYICNPSGLVTNCQCQNHLLLIPDWSDLLISLFWMLSNSNQWRFRLCTFSIIATNLTIETV